MRDLRLPTDKEGWEDFIRKAKKFNMDYVAFHHDVDQCRQWCGAGGFVSYTITFSKKGKLWDLLAHPDNPIVSGDFTLTDEEANEAMKESCGFRMGGHAGRIVKAEFPIIRAEMQRV